MVSSKYIFSMFQFMIILISIFFIGCINKKQINEDNTIKYPDNNEISLNVSINDNIFQSDLENIPINIEIINMRDAKFYINDFHFFWSYNWTIISTTGLIYSIDIKQTPFIENPDYIILEPRDSYKKSINISIIGIDPLNPNFKLATGDYTLIISYFMHYSITSNTDNPDIILRDSVYFKII